MSLKKKQVRAPVLMFLHYCSWRLPLSHRCSSSFDYPIIYLSTWLFHTIHVHSDSDSSSCPFNLRTAFTNVVWYSVNNCITGVTLSTRTAKSRRLYVYNWHYNKQSNLSDYASYCYKRYGWAIPKSSATSIMFTIISLLMILFLLGQQITRFN